jgi:hypothetical protein
VVNPVYTFSGVSFFAEGLRKYHPLTFKEHETALLVMMRQFLIIWSWDDLSLTKGTFNLPTICPFVRYKTISRCFNVFKWNV